MKASSKTAFSGYEKRHYLFICRNKMGEAIELEYHHYICKADKEAMMLSEEKNRNPCLKT